MSSMSKNGLTYKHYHVKLIFHKVFLMLLLSDMNFELSRVFLGLTLSHSYRRASISPKRFNNPSTWIKVSCESGSPKSSIPPLKNSIDYNFVVTYQNQTDFLGYEIRNLYIYFYFLYI